jgi:hypothetical protein
MYFRTLPSAIASSRAVGAPGPGAEVVKDRMEPVLDERSVYIKYVTEPGNFSGQINPFLPLAAARPLTTRSWPEALNAKDSRHAGRMAAISQNPCPLLAQSACPNRQAQTISIEFCRRWPDRASNVPRTAKP